MSIEKFETIPGTRPLTLDDLRMVQKSYTATLTFDLTDEEGQENFKDAVDGRSAGSAIWELGKILRDFEKYGVPDSFETPMDIVESLRDSYYDILSEKGIRRHGY